MADSAPTQPSADPKPANQPEPGQQPEPKPAADPKPAAASTDFDPAKLSSDQLNKVLENPELWKNPRLAGLLASDKELKKLQKANEDAENERLKSEQKWQELADKKTKEAESLAGSLKNMSINQALTNALVPLGVVDLDGALKLVDREKISVDENGSVSGLDEAVEALKTDRSYLFNGTSKPTTVGGPTNPTNGSQNAGPSKFKSSQITPEFYKANEKAILEAYASGLVEDDGPPAQ